MSMKKDEGNDVSPVDDDRFVRGDPDSWGPIFWLLVIVIVALIFIIKL